jgi:16S rRNA processing protein RimM
VSDPNWDDMITVGRVVRPHGRNGQVVVASETDFSADRFKAGERVWRLSGDRADPLVIRDSRPFDALRLRSGQGRWVVGFQGVDSINAAETLRNSELRLPADALRQLGSQQYYVHDLTGCRVETIDGRVVGQVERVELGTGTPILVVAGAKGEVLVPLAEEICRRVDVPARLIVIDPPPGLLELNA